MAHKKPCTGHILFDVGSASVGVCVARPTAGGVHILWSARAEYAQSETHTYNEYVTRMQTALKALSDELAQKGMRIAARDGKFSARRLCAYAVLSTPWSVGHSNTVTVQYPGGKTIDQHVLDSLAQKAHHASMESPAVREWEANMGGAMSPLELSLSHATVDGYAYALAHASIPRVRGTALTLTVHTAMSPSDPLEYIRRTLQRHVNRRDITLKSRSGVLLSRIATQFSDMVQEHASLGAVILGEHMTELVGLRDGAVVAEHAVPYGLYHLLRGTQADGGKSAGEQQTDIWWSALQGFGTARGQHVLEQAPEHFAQAVTYWQRAVREGMYVLWGDVVPATTLLLYADARIAPYCAAAFHHVEEAQVPEWYVPVYVPYALPDTTRTEENKGLGGAHDTRMHYMLTQIAHGAQDIV